MQIARPALPQTPNPAAGSPKITIDREARVLSYRVILDVPTELALYLARLLRSAAASPAPGTGPGH